MASTCILLNSCKFILTSITQAEMALRSDGFVDIDIHTLESVLSRETLNCKEIHVWDAALRWASAECLRQDLEPTSANQRQLLGEYF